MSLECPLRFAPSFSSPSLSNYDVIGQRGSYKLLELPAELCKIVESGKETQFTIRGRTTDDAVLCTASQTYALRAVTLSNTILVTTAPSSASDDVSMDTDVQLGSRGASGLIVRDELSQILELVPSVPKLHRLHTVLKGCEYEEGHERDGDSASENENENGDIIGDGTGYAGGFEGGERPKKRARYTKDTIRGEVQASDAELKKGFKEFRILEIDGHLRPLSMPYLTHILESLLTAVLSERLPLPPGRVPVRHLVSYLESELEMEIGRGVVRQVMEWFGEVEVEAGKGGGEETWRMDQKAIIGQVGLGHLMPYKDDPVPVADFLAKWRDAVGDYFAPSVELSFLEGAYLLHPAPAPAPASGSPPTHLTYFPLSSLPASPQQLFSDLFLTRTRWRAEDIEPFLAGVARGRAEREKLLAKYARATVDAGGSVWYTTRATGV